ncbi:efflux RND transporter permease subunit [Gimesia chilikensis]|uniref:efflux RND transporter permease subunit n=1 Tax=Gimesia chilikensis TaxID=2605989 RepID=UPI0011885EE4|nr:MMPL family transporter [Gimesia chilikensis]MCR9229728.1 MMPL family transporter [bacterium]QDT87736.1 MMPL family protein [Gimesia chilikensis]
MSRQPESWLESGVNLLYKLRWGLLVVFLILTGFAYFPASKLDFEQSIESLYAKDDQHLLDYLESKRLFGGDEFVFVAYTVPGLLGEEGSRETDELKEVRKFSQELSQVPGVNTDVTQNLANALSPPKLNFLLRVLIRQKRDELIELSRGVLIGDDNETTAIVLRLLPEDQSPVPRAETFKQIRELAHAHEPRAYVVGEPVQVYDMFRYVEEDGDVLFKVSLSLLAVVLLLLFRRLRWVALPLLVVICSIWWTEATLVIGNLQLSMVSSMLNSLVTIIGIATVAHVAVHFQALQRENVPRPDAIRRTMVELLPAIFWTCATTAAGFLSLLTSEIAPVRSFGIMMALGTLMVLIASTVLLPGGMSLGYLRQPSKQSDDKGLARKLKQVAQMNERYPKRILWGSLIFVIFAAAGFSRLTIETDFSKNFRDSSEIVKALDFVETRLGGASTWEVNFPAPSQLNMEYLDRVRALAEDLQQVNPPDKTQLTKVISITDTLDFVPSKPFASDPIQSKLDQIEDLQADFESSLYNPEQGRMRIVLRALERQSAEEKLSLIHKVDALAKKHFPGSETKESDQESKAVHGEPGKAAGIFILLAYLIDSLLRDQLYSFLLAATSIWLIMSLAFRSLKLGLISMVPNLFPIVVVIGVMGWTGLTLNIGTAMIASVSMGLTTDSSIHFISSFLRARSRGASTDEALRSTQHSVGRAIIYATSALVAGFSVLTLSHFIPLIYFGALVSVAMVGGVFGDLVLMPILLRLTYPDKAESAA